MQRGYQVVEPPSFDIFTTIFFLQMPVAVAVLEWAIDRMKVQYPNDFTEVDIEVIPVTYFGTYPAIGIHYRDVKDPVDLGPKVSDAVDAILESHSFADFLSFIKQSHSCWNDVWQNMQNGSRSSDK